MTKNKRAVDGKIKAITLQLMKTKKERKTGQVAIGGGENKSKGVSKGRKITQGVSRETGGEKPS